MYVKKCKLKITKQFIRKNNNFQFDTTRQFVKSISSLNPVPNKSYSPNKIWLFSFNIVSKI